MKKLIVATTMMILLAAGTSTAQAGTLNTDASLGEQKQEQTAPVFERGSDRDYFTIKSPSRIWMPIRF